MERRHHAGTMDAMGGSRTRVLVVDDDAKIVQLLRTYLERERFHVDVARDGRQALETFHASRPDLIVLDGMLPEIDGIEVCREVRTVSDVPVLMLSARGSVADRVLGINEGADDYLPKPFSPAELVVRVKALLRRIGRDGAERTSQLRHADLTIDLQRYEVHRGQQPIALTYLEFRLLAALVDAGGRVLSRDQLLDRVYGVDGDAVLDRTIDVHVGRLREKLGDDPERPRYVTTVRGVGYRAAPTSGAHTSESSPTTKAP